LIQLDAALRVFRGDHRVVQFDQVFLSHCEPFLTDFLGLGLGRKCDHDEVAHI
jgi:hypothetical protein